MRRESSDATVRWVRDPPDPVARRPKVPERAHRHRGRSPRRLPRDSPDRATPRPSWPPVAPPSPHAAWPSTRFSVASRVCRAWSHDRRPLGLPVWLSRRAPRGPVVGWNPWAKSRGFAPRDRLVVTTIRLSPHESPWFARERQDQDGEIAQQGSRPARFHRAWEAGHSSSPSGPAVRPGGVSHDPVGVQPIGIVLGAHAAGLSPRHERRRLIEVISRSAEPRRR